MKRRDLISVRTGSVLGSVTVDGEVRRLNGWASDVLSGLRRKYKTDDKIVDVVMEQGWANQSLYFGEVIDDAQSVRTP